MPEERRSVRNSGYGEPSSPWESPQDPAGMSHAYNSAPALCLSILTQSSTDTSVHVAGRRAGRAPPLLQFPIAVGGEPRGSVPSTLCTLCIFLWEWWRTFFGHINVSLVPASFTCRVKDLLSFSLVQRRFPCSLSHWPRCSRRQGEGVGNGVLRLHHEKRYWIKNRKTSYVDGRWSIVFRRGKNATLN